MITTQYQARGVIFSGSTGIPFITSDSANPTSPVLSGDPQFEGPITVTFVNPNNPAAAATTNNNGFDAGFFDIIGSTSVTYFDVNGNVISSETNTALGIEHFTPPNGIHSFTIQIVGSEPAGFAIDNLAFQIQPQLVIKQPKVNDSFPLTQNDFLSTDNITFEADDDANSGHVNWSVLMEYQTSGGRGAFQTTDTFNSVLNSTTTRTYNSEGGRLTVDASEPANSGGQTASPVKFAFVVGSPIPDATITARLVSLYNGATPNLLTGIAAVESSYRQFASRTLFGFSGSWPVESFDGGSHIGLMQMPVNKTDAWDWHANTRDGANLFADKLRAARRIEGRIRKQTPGLPRLTDIQIENMAVVLYGPFASGSLDMQYYIPQVTGNTAQWIINTANNPNGVNYADSVRNSVR